MRTSIPATLPTRHDVPNTAINSPAGGRLLRTRHLDSGCRRQRFALLNIGEFLALWSFRSPTGQRSSPAMRLTEPR
jgi:hypothetical protein